MCGGDGDVCVGWVYVCVGRGVTWGNSRACLRQTATARNLLANISSFHATLERLGTGEGEGGRGDGRASGGLVMGGLVVEGVEV